MIRGLADVILSSCSIREEIFSGSLCRHYERLDHNQPLKPACICQITIAKNDHHLEKFSTKEVTMHCHAYIEKINKKKQVDTLSYIKRRQSCSLGGLAGSWTHWLPQNSTTFGLSRQSSVLGGRHLRAENKEKVMVIIKTVTLKMTVKNGKKMVVKNRRSLCLVVMDVYHWIPGRNWMRRVSIPYIRLFWPFDLVSRGLGRNLVSVRLASDSNPCLRYSTNKRLSDAKENTANAARNNLVRKVDKLKSFALFHSSKIFSKWSSFVSNCSSITPFSISSAFWLPLGRQAWSFCPSEPFNPILVSIICFSQLLDWLWAILDWSCCTTNFQT